MIFCNNSSILLRFNRNTRDITIECLPRWSDPSQPDAVQYPGWSVKINQLDNYGRMAYDYLPKIQVTGMTDPGVQVIDGENGEVVYTLLSGASRFSCGCLKMGFNMLMLGDWRRIR